MSAPTEVTAAPMVGPPKYLTPAELAAELGTTERTLFNWRRTNYGPPWMKSGRSIKYPSEPFYRWVAANTRQPTEPQPRHTNRTARDRAAAS
jgi:hypothetical protein